jgi:DNA (cytosine-5)-methyltransferase 1
VNVGSLFSGIGGLDEGLRRAGLSHLFFCESDNYRRDVLRIRFPGVPVYEDVRSIGTGHESGRQYVHDEGCSTHPPPRHITGIQKCDPRVRDERAITEPLPTGIKWPERPDLLAGGFPCQDLSVAGRRKGLAGERSSLFHEFARIADALRPGWLLIENVPGLLSSNGGRDFGVVLGTLADLGYGLGWRTLDSRFFGVPQRRRRVFIVGALADGDPRAAAERCGEILAVGQGCDRHPASRGEARQDVAYALADGSGNRTGSGRDGQDTLIAAPLEASDGHHGYSSPRGDGADNLIVDENLVTAFYPTGGSKDGFWQENLSPPMKVGTGVGAPAGIGIAQTAGVRRLTPTECERLQALPDEWTNLSGTPDSRRYAALGDAVTATVAEWIGRRLIQCR